MSNEALAKELLASMVVLADKLGQKGLDNASSVSAQLLSKFVSVQALAAPEKEAMVESIRAKFEKVLRKGQPGPELRESLMDKIEQLRKALTRSGSSLGVRHHHKAVGQSISATKLNNNNNNNNNNSSSSNSNSNSNNNNINSSESPLASSPGGSAQAASKLFVPIQQRGRSTSLHIPKGSLNPPKVEKLSDPVSPLGSPRGLSASLGGAATSLLSPRNSVGVLSPRGVMRQVSFPRSLRWDVADSLRIPPSMSETDVENAILGFFDGVSDLVTEGIINPTSRGGQGSKQSAKHFQKSPRMSKLPLKRQEMMMSSLFGSIDSVLRLNSWTEIFHARLGLTQMLASGQLLDALTELCNVILSKGVTESISEVVTKRVVSLKLFLETYKLDVDSAVIGVELEESLVSGYGSIVELDSGTGEEDNQSLGGSGTINFAGSSNGGNNNISSSNHTRLDFVVLREKVLSLAELQSPEVVMAQIAELASRLKLDDFRAFRVGDIGVVKMNGRLVYGRVIRRDEVTGALQLSVGLFGPRLTVRSEAQIRPLTSEIHKLIERGQIGQVVVDVYERVHRKLAQFARSHVVDSLGVVFSYPEEWECAKGLICSLPAAGNISNLALLRKLEADALMLVGNPLLSDTAVLGKMGEIFGSYLESLSSLQFSGKGRDLAVGRVVGLGVTLHQVISSELTALVEALQSRIRVLENECEDLLSGTRKNRMTVEWLTTVREAVNSLLHDHGFDPKASNSDYISVRPTDIGGMKIRNRKKKKSVVTLRFSFKRFV